MNWIFIFCLLPLLACLIIRQYLSKTTSKLEDRKSFVNLNTFLQTLLPKQVTLIPSTKFEYKKGTLSIPKEHLESKLLSDHLLYALPTGLISLGAGTNTWLQRHSSLRQFNLYFPPFGILVVVFGFIAKSIPANLCVVIIFATVGLTCLNSLFITWVRHKAAKEVLYRIKILAPYARSEDVILFKKACTSLASEEILPTFLKPFPK